MFGPVFQAMNDLDRLGPSAALDNIFLDTSVQIARLLRVQMKQPTEALLSRYRRKASGTVALQEFKRRVLKEAAYLLTNLNKTKSYNATLEHVTTVLPGMQERKRMICQLLLHGVLHDRSDQELTERARLYLRTLLMHGEKLFVRFLDDVVPLKNCYLARLPVQEKRRYLSYTIETKCSKTKGKCSIATFLQQKTNTCLRLLEFLNQLPRERMTVELERAREFLRKIAAAASTAADQEEPCLKYGDLLLCLESEGWPVFYTMNYKESQAFADFLGQQLIIRPNNPANADEIYQQSSKPWPLPSES
jgi:hypothetical protein